MKFKNLALFFIIVSLSGCAVFRDVTKAHNGPYDVGSITDRYEGNIPNEKNDFFSTMIVFKKNFKGERWAEITSPVLYSGMIVADVTGDIKNDFRLSFKSFKYIANWSNGWTIGESEASGDLLFAKDNDKWKSSVKDKMELFEVIKGGIRQNLDDQEYYLFDEGIKKVKERVDRVNAVVDFLKKQKFAVMPEFFVDPLFKKGKSESFMKQTQFLLFPETLGIEYLYKNKKLPDVYKMPENIKNDFTVAEGLVWRKSYSIAVFPEYMRPARDSGWLWIDYEEAKGLFVIFYNIDYYFDKVLANTEFKKVK